MTGLAIVPAKGTSQRLPGKILRELAGKPLLYYTLDALADHFTDILVASDSTDIRLAASKHPTRPQTITLPACTTSGTAKVLDSVQWLVGDRKVAENYDFIGMYLPTCPFRQSEDVQQSLDMFQHNQCDGLIGTTDYNFPPELGLQIVDGRLVSAHPSEPWLNGNTRSQDWMTPDRIIRPNGAVYLKHAELFAADMNFYTGHIINYHMSRNRSIDIDTLDDFLEAERLIQRANERTDYL